MEEKEITCRDIERSIIKTFRKEIWCKFTKAINEYELISDGDKIAVCISGGKDSMVMAKLFQELIRHGKHNFELEFIVMDPGYAPANRAQIEKNAAIMEIPVHIFETDIFDATTEIGSNICYMCARMRRGNLYAKAKELGCNKIALGHHYDDVIETILMGMLYGGQMQGMMPKLHSTNFEGMELIRPLYLIRERDIIRWKNHNNLTFLGCACKVTQSEEGSKRKEIKNLIYELESKSPEIAFNIFRSAQNVNIDTLIEYKQKGVRHNFLETYND
ncbi:MAG: tRNA 2-thiocytidine biosynthesis protein TtcA [Lachnospiraceae bacterium]|nr:tRNA 2-thiocytidine biosynthesis protein TtcA [Lachnospiraceae bacterium]